MTTKLEKPSSGSSIFPDIVLMIGLAMLGSGVYMNFGVGWSLTICGFLMIAAVIYPRSKI